MGWYHISYRSYNAVRPPLSPRFSPALPLCLSSRSHSTAFPHPLTTLVSLPCPSSPSHSFSFSLALSSLPRVPSPRVSPLASSPAASSTCVSAASSRASCLHFALTFSPPRLLLSRCSALPPPFSPPPLPSRYIATLHCTLERFLFLFLRADPPLALPIYQARRIRVALRPRARGC